MQSKTFVLYFAMVGLALVAIPLSSRADTLSDIEKVGAMEHGENRIAKGEGKRKYKRLSVSTFQAFDDLDSSGKTSVLVYKKIAKDGDCLGYLLDEDCCDSR